MVSVASRAGIACAALCLTVAAACDSSEPRTPSEPLASSGKASAETAPSGAPEETRFVSSRYGYTISLPSGWEQDKAEEDLEVGEVPSPTNPAVDQYQPGTQCRETGCGLGSFAEEAELWVGAAAAKSPDVEAHADAVSDGVAEKLPPCGKPDSEEKTTVDDEPAVLMSWSCEFEPSSGTSPIFVMNVVVVYEGSGFLIGWLAPLGTEAQSRSAFGDVLDTFTFD